MKKLMLAMTLAVTTAYSAVALAGEWTTTWDTIDSLESFGDDLHIFGLSLSPNPAGCSNTSVAKVKYSLSATQKERLALVLTSAFLAGRQVKVKIDSSACQDNSPVVYGVDVR